MIQLYNSLTRKKEPFEPLLKKNVGLYTCGPTVYNYVHIGNLRTYIFEDILKRVLLINGFTVQHVLNITDVGHLTDDGDNGEDKMERSAREKQESAWELAKRYTNIFLENLQDLHILPPNILPKATDHISEQIALIQMLEQKGFTYQTPDGIYFDTTLFPGYGEMSSLDPSGMAAGARVALQDKEHPTDFALWKFSPPGSTRQMEWKSPWGTGFPGWHIECSAMSMKYLGETFDIHTGGIDHKETHHPNEIAQSEAATGKPLARYWLHGEFLVLEGDTRMGKSQGNFITLASLKEKGYSPLSYRYFTFQAHYRKQLVFSFQALDAAAVALKKMYREIAEIHEHISLEEKISSPSEEYVDTFLDAVNDDLNMPEALAALYGLLHSSSVSASKKWASIAFMDQVFGLDLQKNALQFLQRRVHIPKEVLELVAQREHARSAKDWKAADAVRQHILSVGWTVEDTQNGPHIEPNQ